MIMRQGEGSLTGASLLLGLADAGIEKSEAKTSEVLPPLAGLMVPDEKPHGQGVALAGYGAQ